MKILCPSPAAFRGFVAEHSWYDYLMAGFRELGEIEFSETLTETTKRLIQKGLLIFEINGRKVVYDCDDSVETKFDWVDRLDAVYFKIQARPKDKTKPIGQTVTLMSFFDKLDALRQLKDQQNYTYDVIGLFRTTNQTWRVRAVEIVRARTDWKTKCGLHLNNNQEKIPTALLEPRMKYFDYLEAQTKSKLVLVFAGLGGKAAFSWRLTEALAMGCAIVTHKHETILPNQKQFEKSIIKVNTDLSDLEQKIDYYLSHDTEREQIASQGRKYFDSHLSPKQMAQRIIKGVKS